MPTSAQQNKFDEFQKRPLRDECIKVVKAAISQAGLSASERGSNWGVTVCPDNKTLIRLNVGNVSQMSVQRGFSEKIDPSGDVYYLVVAVQRGALGLLGVPRGLHAWPGFVKHVDDSIIVFGALDRWSDQIFEHQRVVRAMRKHIESATRTLPDSNWHNPLVDDIL